ncbi:MAG: acetamidase [Chthonomonadales bacterium]|nr:acetamidase [Chthonomonadales bacterium]
MAKYTIQPERSTLHGTFSREYPTVLTIESGDSVVYSTLDAGWNLAPEPEKAATDPPVKFEPRDPDKDRGHALCGPIAIAGAEPGMTLEVVIEEIRPARRGWTSAGGWPHPVHERLGTTGREAMHVWTLDADAGTGRNQFGHEVSLHPFMGVMGMPSDEEGYHSTAPPRFTGGNLDCKELVAGTSLFLPIAVSGGLFSVGDGHAAQGDGEVCVTAIECPMERVALTFRLHPEMSLAAPRALTPTAWITFGLHEDLQEATYLALDAMLSLIGEQYGVERVDALALASVVVDMRVTQIVNGVRGVHAVLAHDAIRKIEGVAATQ